MNAFYGMPVLGNNEQHLILLSRFLRATKWADANAAIKRLEDTLKWRREFGVYDTLSAELVAPEVRPYFCWHVSFHRPGPGCNRKADFVRL